MSWNVDTIQNFNFFLQIRFVMKNHAFVRSNVPRALISIQKSEGRKDGKSLAPTFEKFIYFMFAPTLIYRDHYPR